jgi:YqjK-like protein
MNEELLRLAERRATLVAQADHQRDTMALAAEPWRKPLTLADQGLSALRYLWQHPLLLAGMAVTVAILRPRFIFRWAQRGWLAWRLTRGVRRML